MKIKINTDNIKSNAIILLISTIIYFYMPVILNRYDISKEGHAVLFMVISVTCLIFIIKHPMVAFELENIIIEFKKHTESA